MLPSCSRGARQLQLRRGRLERSCVSATAAVLISYIRFASQLQRRGLPANVDMRFSYGRVAVQLQLSGSSAKAELLFGYS